MRLDLHSGTPLWFERDEHAGASHPPLSENCRAEVAVVGAGVTGAAVAHALSAAGRHVVVLDRREAGSGSSAASTGFLLYETDSSLRELERRIGAGGSARVYRLGLEAVDRIERFCRSANHDCGFARRPSLYVASNEEAVADLRDEYERRVRAGLEVDWLESAALDRAYGLSAPAAIRAHGNGEVNCYRLTRELLSAACRSGASIHSRTTVTTMRPAGRHWCLETEHGHVVTADRVVWATGYEAFPQVPPRAHLTSTWVIATTPTTEPVRDRCLIWQTGRPYLYIRTSEDGRIVAGGEDEPCAECHRSAWWLWIKARRLAGRVRRLFPDRPPLEIAYRWAGTFSTTTDGLPIIGESAGHAGIWLALGYGGNGITFGVIAATLIEQAFNGHATGDLRLFAR